MILSSLCDLYERLLADPNSGVASPGYSESSAVVALELSCEGRLVRAVPLGTQKGKRIIGLKMKVPERVKRSAGGAANFLCDPSEYILGKMVTTAARARDRHRMCVELHERILTTVHDDGARAVCAFLSNWDPENCDHDKRLADVSETLDTGGNIVFRLEGDGRFVHERPAVRKEWNEYCRLPSPDAVMGQCLVTGKYGPISRLHKSISGIRGAQSTGASVVSFNFKAVESYGREQGANSPVSEDAVFAYGTALNWLISNSRHRVLVGDTTVVFWAERAGPEENLLLSIFGTALGAYEDTETDDAAGASAVSNDEGTTGRIQSILERAIHGRPIAQETVGFDKGIRFYMLGLSPNAARVAIRFWHVDTFGGSLKNVTQHFEDMAIVHGENERPMSIGRLLLETAPAAGRKPDNVPNVLVGSLMRSVLEGTSYPQSLYATLISRIRVDSNDPDSPRLERKVNYPRAAYIKAHLRRKARILGDFRLKEVLTEVLNTENKNPGYLLGRLFALLEKAQQDANPTIKATIRDRYYASASATPVAAFPVLLRLAQHHLAKSEYGGYVDKLIEEVMADIQSFPAHLDLDQQGLFALGYYQQKSALYRKKNEGEMKGGVENEESR